MTLVNSHTHLHYPSQKQWLPGIRGKQEPPRRARLGAPTCSHESLVGCFPTHTNQLTGSQLLQTRRESLWTGIIVPGKTKPHATRRRVSVLTQIPPRRARLGAPTCSHPHGCNVLVQGLSLRPSSDRRARRRDPGKAKNSTFSGPLSCPREVRLLGTRTTDETVGNDHCQAHKM